MLEEFRIALEEEIREIKKNAYASAIPITNGNKLKSAIDEYTYRFRVDTSINSPSDSPATIVVDHNRKYDAVIVSFDDPYLVVSTTKDMGDYVGYARLESDLSMLMEKLISRIEQNSETKNTLGEKMLDVSSFSGEPLKLLSELKYKLNNRQIEAVESSVGRDLTYIWGPPGTGKTMTIGGIIEEFFRREKTVLLVSHTNTAVDGAIKEACKQLYGALEALPILRLGQARLDLIETFPQVSLKYQQKVLSEELMKNLDSKSTERKEVQEQARVAAGIVEKCDYILEATQRRTKIYEDTNSLNKLIEQSQQKIKENQTGLDEFADKRRNLENYLAGLKFELDGLFEKEEVVKKHAELSHELNSKTDRYNKNKNATIALENELSAANKRLIDTEEKIVYSKKREELEFQKAQVFSPEKQKDIIVGIETDIQSASDSMISISGQEANLNELLDKAKNSNFFVKAIQRIPDPAHVMKMMEAITKEKVETNDRLASLHILKEKKVMEYQETLALYAELATFPTTASYQSLIMAREQIKAEMLRLKDKISDEYSHLELDRESMINAEGILNDFTKSICFDLNHVTKAIYACRQMIKTKNTELDEVKKEITLMKRVQHSLLLKKDQQEREIKSLLDELARLDEAVNELKVEIQCSDLHEIKSRKGQQYFGQSSKQHSSDCAAGRFSSSQ